MKDKRKVDELANSKDSIAEKLRADRIRKKKRLDEIKAQMNQGMKQYFNSK